jgi:hypothetical protein
MKKYIQNYKVKINIKSSITKSDWGFFLKIKKQKLLL